MNGNTFVPEREKKNVLEWLELKKMGNHHEMIVQHWLNTLHTDRLSICVGTCHSSVYHL